MGWCTVMMVVEEGEEKGKGREREREKEESIARVKVSSR